MSLHLTGRVHDLVATATAGGVVAVALTELDVALNIVVGILTSVFLSLGIVIRAKELRAQIRKDRDPGTGESPR